MALTIIIKEKKIYYFKYDKCYYNLVLRKYLYPRTTSLKEHVHVLDRFLYVGAMTVMNKFMVYGDQIKSSIDNSSISSPFSFIDNSKSVS